MSLISDWLQVHALDGDTVADCMDVIENGDLLLDLDGSPADPMPGASPEWSTLQEALSLAIRPAFADMLGIEAEALSDLCLAIRWSDLPKGDCPHTIDHGDDQPPEIRMGWGNTPFDLMCLAHEVAHAAQLRLSAGAFMPPVAREVCAFLGELALVAWAERTAPSLAAALLEVWREDNNGYLGDDVALLRSALADDQTGYSYRMNYPLARAAAVALFRSGADRLALFKAGSDAMALLALDRIAGLAGQPCTHLPPLPPPDTAQPALDAYRALGAMALLDIDVWKGQAERRIDDYYTGLLRHLQDRTAFLALDEARRPLGYATWTKAAGDQPLTLLRQTAPFGDHLALQRALAHHLGQDQGVMARHERSARAVQAAW